MAIDQRNPSSATLPVPISDSETSMLLNPNQMIERRFFDHFHAHYPLPSGVLEYDDKPDVRIIGKGGQRILGVEITRLYKVGGDDPTSEQAQRGMRRAVIGEAERIYLSRGGRKICLNVTFNAQYPILGKQDVRKTAEGLAEYAKKISVHRGMYYEYNPIEALPELSYLYHDGGEYPLSRWMNPQPYDTPTLLVERVKEVVTQKSEKVREYTSCAAYWLLIVIDFMDVSQDQGIDWPLGESIGKTPFERILIFKTCFNEVVEVLQRCP